MKTVAEMDRTQLSENLNNRLFLISWLLGSIEHLLEELGEPAVVEDLFIQLRISGYVPTVQDWVLDQAVKLLPDTYSFEMGPERWAILQDQ